MNLANTQAKQTANPSFLKKIRLFATQFVNRQIILILALLFITGLAGAIYNMSRLSSDLIRSQAVQSSALYAQAIKEARTLYSSKVVARLQDVHGVTPTAEFETIQGGIPLPATYLIELGTILSQQTPGTSVRLYSDFPFRFRGAAGGPKDAFEQDAL